MNYEIKKIDCKNIRHQQCRASEEKVIPAHPFRMYVVGSSGSGKTNLIINLLTQPNMYGDLFGTNIAVISPTARQLDKTYEMLDIPETQYFPCDEIVLERIFEITKLAKEEKKSKPLLIILDDIISYKKFCNSKALLKLLVMGRHYNISCMILSQAYHRIPKSLRLNFSSIVFFKGSNKEIAILSEDFCPAGFTNRQFSNLVSKITNKRFDFLFIDLNKSIEDGRYKHNLNEIIV